MGSLALWRRVLAGVLVGVAYAVADALLDAFHLHTGAHWRLLDVMHHAVDTALPVALGGLAGLAIHHMHLRRDLLKLQEAHTAELQRRLAGVERDQGVWVVAAATLHEVKNPLHAMGLVLEELASAPPAEQAGHLERLRRLLDRVDGHVGTLRSFSAQRRAPVQPTALQDVVEAVWAGVADLHGRGRCQLALDGADAGVAVMADPAQLRMLLENVLNNAVENALTGAGPPRVMARLQRNGSGTVVLQVSDSGPPAEHGWAGAMFDPLQTSKPDGLGLGLPIARALARSMGGDLLYENQDGAARFELRLRTAEDA